MKTGRRRKNCHEEEALYKSQSMKVLIVAHSYVLGDAYIGQPVIDYLKGMEVTPIRADVVDRNRSTGRASTWKIQKT